MNAPAAATPLKIVFLGLSITSSWGNGHATTYRSLIRSLCRRGHDVLFLERDVPWYAENRDLPNPPYGRTVLYTGVPELKQRFAGEVEAADLVVVGSYVPDGVEVGSWITATAAGVTAFYDIDTPVTLAKLERGDTEYISRSLIERFDMYLSFTGGRTLRLLETRYGSPFARPLYCSFDPELYYPEEIAPCWDLGYLGTYSADRQPALDLLMLEPARRCPDLRMVVAGPLYPEDLEWPDSVSRIVHLNPTEHRRFYNSQRFTLNITRQDMVRAGYSPSVRLFEAAACATPIVSDYWEGLDSFFGIGSEILIARQPEDTVRYLSEVSDEERRGLGNAARQRVLHSHTSEHRAAELESYARQKLRAR